MTWASRLAKLSAPKCLNAVSAESADSPPKPPNGTNGTIDIGVFPEKSPANDIGETPPADPEREALMAEEYAPLTPPAERLAAVRALQSVALPMPGSLLAGVRDAYACGRCGRGVWISPNWPGPPPALCWQCEREGVQ